VAYRLNNSLFKSERTSVAGPAKADGSTATTASQPAAVVAKKNVPVLGGALVGTELSLPAPEYSAEGAAKNEREGVSATVMVLVKVNNKGQVRSARALYGDKQLQAAAVEAAKKATFSPEKLASKGGVVTGTITYDFGAPRTSQGNPTAASRTSGEDSPVVGGPLVGAELNVPKADYPAEARSKRTAGTATVLVRVSRSGKVISWLTLDGDAPFRAAALKAAKKATFSPNKLPGKGEVVGTITYNFK
jgi:TonB family protein